MKRTYCDDCGEEISRVITAFPVRLPAPHLHPDFGEPFTCSLDLCHGCCRELLEAYGRHDEARISSLWERIEHNTECIDGSFIVPRRLTR